MFPAQIPAMNLHEFSRCDERMHKRDHGLIPSSIQKADISLQGTIERAIWNDEVLRAIEYSEIDVYANNGIIYLSGHIVNMASQKRIENAIRSVPGILGIRNHLILDDKLILDVSESLGTLEHIYGCKFFTGASHGVISLGGIVSDKNVKLLAEKCAASNPNVRAVLNHVRVASATLEVPVQPFLQPAIGTLIYFLDGASGVVNQVIVNPNNRRVVAMTVLVRFTNQRHDLQSLNRRDTRSPDQLVVIPMETVRYLTAASGFLHIKSAEKERYGNFDAASFFSPNVEWTPPYPYCVADILFPVEYQIVEIQPADGSPQYRFEELLESATFKEQVFARENPEG